MRYFCASLAIYAIFVSTLFVPAASAQKRLKAPRTKDEQATTLIEDVKTESPTDSLAPSSSQTDIVGPAGSGQFGSQVTVLPNGNIVVTDPSYDITSPSTIADVGAVYLYNGETLAMISQITGSTANDQVGNGGVTVLSNGNYVVKSPWWSNAGAQMAGAVTWASATAGVSGTVSAANSLVGTRSGDGMSNVTALTNGNYIVHSINWDNGAAAENAGAATFCNGTTGTVGAASASNSLVGTTAFANVGGQIFPLPNGNYLVYNNVWPENGANGRGAVTWGSGTVGVAGAVSAANSLVGSTPGDRVGSGGIRVLPNSNYVVSSGTWDNGAAVDAGAVTFGNGNTGISGAVSSSNSLVGSVSGDGVGGVQVLTNSNYVVTSVNWDNGAATNAGAVTWASGLTGRTGPVSALNSLVGSSTNDFLGLDGVTALANGNYVVVSRSWSNGALIDVGAATWGNGSSGSAGAVSSSNSLIGTIAGDGAGMYVVGLTNGNYVVGNRIWGANDEGAATFADGSTGISGAISAANSLVGTAAGDGVADSVVALANGNYVVGSYQWDNGGIVNAGAATFGNGHTGIVGSITASNSLVGSTANNYVSSDGITPLTNGNYVVRSPSWDNGPAVDAGAATFGDGSTGASGPVSASNSLVGSITNNLVGIGGITALSNGNYVVRSYNWDTGSATDVGAMTFGSGATGVSGVVSASNSLVGSVAGDQVGLGGALPLANGNYIVRSSNWDNGAIVNAGAVTFGNGTGGVFGSVSSLNSIVGSTANDNVGSGGVLLLPDDNYIFITNNWDNGSTLNARAVTHGAGNGGTVGAISASNSIRGTVASGTLMIPTSPVSNERLVVGRPSSNAVTVLNPTYTAVADGNRSAAATWNYGAFEKPHDVVIPSGRTVTLDADVPGPGGSLTVNSGGQMIVDGERASGSPITNAGIVDLSMGKLNMGANMFSSVCGAIENGVGANNYLVGAAQKQFCSTGSYTFPVGTANGYAPVNVNITSLNSNPSSLTISSTASVHPELSPANSLARFWSLTETGDLTADLVFNYLDSDVVGNESAYNLYRKQSASPLEYMPTAVRDSAANTMSINGVSAFSDWAIGSLAPTAASASVSGRVMANGRPVARAIVSFYGSDGSVKKSITNSFGYYRVNDLPVGLMYTASVTDRRYTFDTQVVNLMDNVTGLDFLAQP